MDQTSNGDDLSKTIVFILGAGCSVDCGAPTMQRFMPAARLYARGVQDETTRDDYEAVRVFRRECLGISYIFDRWWENIEDLFTQAHLRKLINPVRGRKLCSQMARVIWDVYRRPRQSLLPVGYDHFATLLWGLAHQWLNFNRWRPVVITTNYDVHLEASLQRPTKEGWCSRVAYPARWNSDKHMKFFLCFDSDLMSHPLIESNEGVAVEVIKLHGSVNWFGAGKRTPEIEWRPVDRAPLPGGRPELKAQTTKQAEDVAAKNCGVPLIVPPLLGKADPAPMISRQLQAAKDALHFAEHIIILGYSFPETDTFMARLLAEGVRQNEKLERIVIVNTHDDPLWKERVSGLFARAWRSNNLIWRTELFSEFASRLSNDNGGGSDGRQRAQGVGNNVSDQIRRLGPLNKAGTVSA